MGDRLADASQDRDQPRRIERIVRALPVGPSEAGQLFLRKMEAVHRQDNRVELDGGGKGAREGRFAAAGRADDPQKMPRAVKAQIARRRDEVIRDAHGDSIDVVGCTLPGTTQLRTSEDTVAVNAATLRAMVAGSSPGPKHSYNRRPRSRHLRSQPARRSASTPPVDRCVVGSRAICVCGALHDSKARIAGSFGQSPDRDDGYESEKYSRRAVRALRASGVYRVGVDLFERRGEALRLTEAGRVALDDADAIFAAGRDLLATLRQTTRQAVWIGALRPDEGVTIDSGRAVGIAAVPDVKSDGMGSACRHGRSEGNKVQKFLVPIAAAFAMLPTPSVALTITQRIAIPDGGWDYASFDSTGNRLVVARTDGVLTVDAATGAVAPQLVTANRLHAAFVISGTMIGVLTSTTSGGAMLFDATSGNVTAEIKTGPKPDAAVYDAGSKSVLVMDNKDGTIALIDPVAGTLTATIAVGGALESAAVDGKGRVFVNVEDKDELVVVDIAKRSVVRRVKLTGCEEPTGLAYTSSGVLIAACGNSVAKVVEAKTGKLLADIVIGVHPDAVLYDATRERAYIPAGGDGSLTVIDTARGHPPRAIDRIATQTGARNGAVDPATGTVYLTAARYAAPVGGARAAMIPGSVEILVVK